nr:MAG TPA: hypothetical protein [Caudoviricetes sp.]
MYTASPSALVANVVAKFYSACVALLISALRLLLI